MQTVCKNCGEPAERNYCSTCGQKTSVGKITVSNILDEVATGIFQVDRGFFYTLIALFRRPGHAIQEYLDGKRKKYFRPVAYVLTLSTVYFLVSQVTGKATWLDDIITGWSNGALNSEEQTKVPTVLRWFSANFAYTTLLLLPLFSLASFLSFRKFGRNYAEHLVINTYTTGQQALIYSAFALVRTVFDHEVLEMLQFLAAISYVFWVFWQFFREGNRIFNILRSLLTYILYLLFSMVVLGVITGLSESFH